MNKEDLKLLGLSEELEGKQEAELIKAINEHLIKREDVLKDETLTGKIVGKRLGAINTLLLKYAGKDHSYSIGEDKKPKPIEELIPLIFGELEEKIKAIESNALLTAEEKFKLISDEKKAIEIEKNQYKGELSKTVKELETERLNSAKNLDGVLIKYAIADKKAKVKWVDNVKKVQLEDYDRGLDANYIFEFEDEKKEKVIPKTKDGQLIPSKKGTGFADLDEVLEIEAETREMLKKNNAATVNTKIDLNNPTPQNGRQVRDLSGTIKQS